MTDDPVAAALDIQSIGVARTTAVIDGGRSHSVANGAILNSGVVDAAASGTRIGFDNLFAAIEEMKIVERHLTATLIPLEFNVIVVDIAERQISNGDVLRIPDGDAHVEAVAVIHALAEEKDVAVIVGGTANGDIADLTIKADV